MSKLPKKYQFFDFSDYGRFPGNWIANRLKNTGLTPIHVTNDVCCCGIFCNSTNTQSLLYFRSFFYYNKVYFGCC